jgi:hypothetical protein
VPAWLALLDEPTGDLSAPAVEPDRERYLVAWHDRARKPHPQARRLDPQVLDAHGDAAEVSLLWPALGTLPLFDDPAVARARRTARGLAPPRCASTSPSTAVTSPARCGSPVRAAGSTRTPFRLLGVPLHLHVGAGLLGTDLRSSALRRSATAARRGRPAPSDA